MGFPKSLAAESTYEVFDIRNNEERSRIESIRTLQNTERKNTNNIDHYTDARGATLAKQIR